MPAFNVNWPESLIRLNPWFPGQFGVPGTDSETGLRMNCTGTVFWVDPNHVDANDNRDGTNPTAPLATVAKAATLVEPYRGDTIAVMHNGFWTYGNPTESNVTPINEAVTIDVPGVRIVGVCPSAPLGVPWTPTANNATCITVTALDVLIEGFCFWDPLYTGTIGVAAAWDAPPFGENVTLRHCFFYDLAYGITFDYAWNCYVEDCRFHDIATQAIHNPSVYGEPDYLTIRNNIFTSCAGAINLPDVDLCILEANRFLNCTVAIAMAGGDANTLLGNSIQGNPLGVNNMINLTGGASNLVSDNYLSCTIAQYDTTCSDATSGSWGGNHCDNGDTTAAPV